MPVHVLDRFYLIISLLVTIGWQLSGFAIAWTFKVRVIFGTISDANILV